MMKEYEFTLKYKLPDEGYDLEALADRLYASCCDDALIGIGIAGKIALNFSRQAENAQEAIISAHQEVLDIVPEASLTEAMPDYVGLTDIAKIVSVSRQQMRKLSEGHISFPDPVHEGSSSIWRLAEVLSWIQVNKNYSFDTSILEVAQVNATLNNLTVSSRINSTKSFISYTRIVAELNSYEISANLLFSDTQNCTSVFEAA